MARAKSAVAFLFLSLAAMASAQTIALRATRILTVQPAESARLA
jgi:hypothetical protein